MVLAKSVDKFIDIYEEKRSKRALIIEEHR